MEKSKVLEVLQRAMDIERQGKAFYQEATEHVRDPMGKRVFGTLAKEEVEHLRLLQTEYEAIHNDQTWVELS
ncbi:MAG TPA: ferritin family protein, partial [Anaerolineae bacterium]|nr:ferritin family protein [Anaerolineae bacterium]